MSDSYFRVTNHQNGLHANGFDSSDPDNLLQANINNGLVTARDFEETVIDGNDDTFIYEAGENEAYYKMSEDSLELTSGQESPLGIVKRSTLGYPDTDSCLSVSPSPGPDCKTKTFDFSMIDPGGDRSNLSAALQVEQEFLDFMFSLPQIQKEAQDKEQKATVQTTVSKPPLIPAEEEKIKVEKKNPARIGLAIGNTSRVGLDHLDNLCRMMEQLGELREQNSRLQRRVQYLEDLKTLQEMHRDMQDSIAARKNALSLGTISLSDSDLRLEDLNKSSLFSMDSEDSLDPTVPESKDKDQLLEIPESSITIQHHSSSEDDRRPCIDKDNLRRPIDKEKKGHKSAWGKVKHMISYNTKRESIRKKSSTDNEAGGKRGSSIPQSLSVVSAKGSSIQESAVGATLDGTGASDPEEYDLDFENLDPDGASWDWDGEPEGGIWMGPTKNNDLPEVDRQMLREDHIHRRRKGKPQLTITVPSNENLSMSPKRNSSRRDDAKLSPVPSLSKIDRKISPDILQISPPPSPRRASNWTKVKQAFLTGHQNSQQQSYLQQENQSSIYRHNLNLVQESSQPSSPMKKDNHSTFSFDNNPQTGLALYESDSASGLSPEISPDELIVLKRPPNEAHQRTGPGSRYASFPAAVVQKNLIELQRTLTGEFNKKLQEWEKLKSPQGPSSGWSEAAISLGFSGPPNTEGHLPQDFKKKLHEWEKMKGKEKYRAGDAGRSSHIQVPHSHFLSHHQHPVSGQDDLKMKIQNEDDLPPDFKKKLTEWEIRKALVGKGQPNVDKLQKNLGEDFNKKMAEWERMKSVGHGKLSVLEMPDSTLTGATPPSMPTSNIPANIRNDSGSVRLKELARLTHLAGVPGVGSGGTFVTHGGLDRKGSSGKFKKTKSGKVEKQSVVKNEGHKNRDKELLWLEKELSKIDREKQRLEREKEKFIEREARLEKMRHAMRQGPAEKKEIYIKTSTGEFRFEGISQTFTKKLYEWEERRGIRPESSTFVLLDPNYKAPEKDGSHDKPKQKSPELKGIVRSRSESSIADIGSSAVLPHQSSVSLNEMEKEDSLPLQNENKCASEPTLSAEDTSGDRAVLVQMVEEVDGNDAFTMKESSIEPDGNKTAPSGEENEMDTFEDSGECSLTTVKHNQESKSRNNSAVFPPYAPAEITKLIDSSGSDDNLAQQNSLSVDDDVTSLMNNQMIISPISNYTDNERQLQRSDSQRSEESYRSLLHENMTLLGKLKEQESLCRALETQMGDIDTKMDNVADQHLKTLEKLHRQVSIMKNSESSGRISDFIGDEELSDDADEAERNQRLIEQLKSRIVELELKGDRLMEEKESLDRAFKLHKEHETQIAESLLLRIRELQDAGAEVNIQTVQCQTEDCAAPEGSNEGSAEPRLIIVPLQEVMSPSTKKRRRKKRDDYRKTDDCNTSNYEEKEESDEDTKKIKQDKENKEYVKRKKKAPPKKVQKLHSLTADLLFQAKRLEGALIARHNLHGEDNLDAKHVVQSCRIPRKRSLKGRSSLRLSTDECRNRVRNKPPKDPITGRTWSSIEAIACAEDDKKTDSATWEGRASSLASESQDLLAMNAELSRMAKELRMEMMNLWSFRESTSPDSNCSDTREQVIIARRSKSNSANGELRSSDDESLDIRDDENNCWLANEARDVLEKIASLHHTHSAPDFSYSSPGHSSANPETNLVQNHRRSPLFFVSSPEIKEKTFNPWETEQQCEYDDPPKENQSIVVNSETEEVIQSWWDVPLPKKRKSKPKLVWSAATVDEPDIAIDEVRDVKEDNEMQVESNECSDQPLQSGCIDHTYTTDVYADFDTPLLVESGTTLGDLLRAEHSRREESNRNVDEERNCSFPSFGRHHRNSSRRSSSASDDDDKSVLSRCLFIKEDDMTENESRTGTLRTNVSSTVRSDVLSSSFEFDDKEPLDFEKEKDQNAYDSFYWQENAHMTYPPAKKSEFTQLQLEKVGLMIAEVSKRLNPDDELKIQQTNAEDANQRGNEYETEVKIELIKKRRGIGGLRTRRVSDTQIPYDKEISPSPKLSTQQDIDALYKEKYFYYRRVERIPSIRRNQSESDVLNHDSSDSNNVFVRTHRTIFTVSGESNSDKSTVTPTFLYDLEKPDNSEHVSRELLTLDNRDHYSRGEHPNSTELASKLANLTRSSKSPSKNVSQENINACVNEESQDSRCSSTVQTSSSPGDGDSTCPSTPKSPTFFHHFPTSFSHTSSPVESKKKVLEAANEASPTVKNMIDQYNRRITEKQELLINPFKPGDPYRRSAKSMSSTNKSLEILRKGRSVGSREKAFDAEKIMKSKSTSVLQMYQSSYDQQFIQRSLSGTNDFASNLVTDTTSTGTLIPPNQSTSSFSNSGTNISIDTIVNDEDCAWNLPQTSDKETESDLRASRIKKAKDEFLARGATPKWTPSAQTNTRDEFLLSLDNDSAGIEGPKKPPRSLNVKQLNIPRKESFRRQSEGGMPEDLQPLPPPVMKSASSGVIERRPHHCARPPSNKEHRKSCLNPLGEPSKLSKGLFKLFKRSKTKDRKDLGTVQHLCRQSLVVDVNGAKRKSNSHCCASSSNPESIPTLHENVPSSIEHNDFDECAGSSRTLPRPDYQHENQSTASRSCPSSPVNPRKSKAAQWIEKSKRIFQSRSPSPNHKPS